MRWFRMWGGRRARPPSSDEGGAARPRFRRPAGRPSDAGGDLLDPSVDLVGVTVTQLRFDFDLTVALDGGTALRLGTPFEFAAPDAEPTVIDPEQDLDRMGPLLALHRKRVTAFAADTTGALSATFSDGSALRCWADDRHEAWELSFADGRSYVCLPGRGVAVWDGGGD